ncbi:MAG: hypothetical protein C4551_05145 [Bacillota bacterium]|nr:MAG: hypothetical protein C4551_05145 [Bacillota bacterium]
MPKLDAVVSLSPGFKTAVSLAGNLEDDVKTAAYIPTKKAAAVLEDLASGLHPLSGQRSRLITGTYGTGKSHLALVIARMYRDGLDQPALKPVLKKLEKWPTVVEKLKSERGRLPGRFLLVLLEGDEGSFDDSLLKRLDEALSREGLEGIVPQTAYDAALARVDELRSKYPSDLDRLARIAAHQFGFESIKMLEGQLRDRRRQAYDRFCELHKAAFAGAPFYLHHMMSPKDVYGAVAKILVEEKGYEGIVVIWDEFGRYMERVVDDPRGHDGQSVQSFADGCCNKSGPFPVHQYLICHRSMEEYARISSLARASGTSKEEQDEWKKIRGRFNVFHMTTSDQEVYDLIDRVVVQDIDSSEWQLRATGWRDHLDASVDEAVRLRLFTGLSREQVREVVVEGTYPLHPMAAFCLPKISEHVAQNERTLFTFLSDSGQNSLGPFLRETELAPPDKRPVFFTADMLWDYFSHEVQDHPVYGRVYKKYVQADAEVSPDDALAKRVLKTIAVLQVARSDSVLCKDDTLAYALGISASDQPRLREVLKDLCNRSGDRGRLLVQNAADGQYRFGSPASDQALDAKVEMLVEKRFSAVSPLQHLRRISAAIPEVQATIAATGYSDDFMLSRGFIVHFTDPSELKEPGRWLQNLGNGAFVDGYALLVLAEDHHGLRDARAIATTDLTHPQILIGIPKDPLPLSALLRRHEALTYLETSEGNLFGPGADLREEWEQQKRDVLAAIRLVLGPLFDPEKGLLDWFNAGKQAPPMLSSSALKAWASSVMQTVFPLTPRIAHDRLVSEDGRDNFVSSRRAIADMVLKADGAAALGNVTSSRDKMVIEAVYRDNGILKKKGSSWTLGMPDPDQFPAMGAVWRVVDEAIRSARTEPLRLSDLTKTLRGAPYGIRSRVLPLLFVAVAREYILRGNLSFESSGGKPIARPDGKVIDEALLGSPYKWSLVFTDIGETQEAILLGVAKAFGVEPDEDRGALVEKIHEACSSWWRSLPHFSRITRMISDSTAVLRDRLFQPLAADNADARRLLLEDLPKQIRTEDGRAVSPDGLASVLAGPLREISSAVELSLVPSVCRIIEDTFAEGPGRSGDWLQAMAAWYDRLDQVRQRLHLPGDPVIVLGSAREAAQGGNVALEDFCGAITGTPLRDWGDGMLERFRGRLEGALTAINAGVSNGGTSGQVRVEIHADGESYVRTFVPVRELSPMAENLKAILAGAVNGIGKTLPAGECETVVVDIVRRLLK